MREIGIDRPRFDIKVSTQTFTLYFIPNIARKKYIDFWARVEKMLEAMKIQNKKKRKEMVDAISSDDEDELLREIIQIIMEANGYVYDAEWWEGHTDAEMQLEFVRAVIENADDSKKKVMAMLKA
jgi:hypothetical protein